MAPTLQDVAGLKDLVNQLQARIEKIERSFEGASPAEQLRMILMGPPGAGEFYSGSLITADVDAAPLRIADTAMLHL